MKTNQEKENKLKMCADCKQEPATIHYAESVLDMTHGFTKWICQKCYDKIRDNNTWYKEGIQTGRNLQKNEDIEKVNDFKKIMNNCGNLKVREVKDGEEAGIYKTKAYIGIINELIEELKDEVRNE